MDWSCILLLLPKRSNCGITLILMDVPPSVFVKWTPFSLTHTSLYEYSLAIDLANLNNFLFTLDNSWSKYNNIILFENEECMSVHIVGCLTVKRLLGSLRFFFLFICFLRKRTTNLTVSSSLEDLDLKSKAGQVNEIIQLSRDKLKKI